MSTVVEAFNYRIGIDASKLEDGGRLTRRELSLVRSEFRTLTDPTERITHRLDLLDKALRTGTISTTEHAEAVRRLRATLPDVIAAEKERNAIAERGKQLTDRYESSLHKYRRELQEISELEAAGAIDARTANLARRDARAGGLNAASGIASRIPGGGALAGFASEAAALGPAIAGIVAGVVAIGVAYKTAHAIASAFTAEVFEQAERMNNLRLSARLLGADVERLTALQYAAETSAGIGAEQSVAMLEKLSARLAEAAIGTGEAKPILETLGLDPRSLAIMDPTEALDAIADRIADIENPAERARIAMKLFEEEGRKMALVMQDGAAGLQRAKERADELGFTVSSIDASAVNIATDRYTEMKMVVEGLASKTAGELAPALTVIVNNLEPLILNLRTAEPLIGHIVANALRLTGAFVDAAGAVFHLVRAIEALKDMRPGEALAEFQAAYDSMTADTGTRLATEYAEAKRQAEEAAEADRQRAEQSRQMMLEAMERETTVDEEKKKKAEEAEARRLEANQNAVENAERELAIRQRMIAIEFEIMAANQTEFDSVIRAQAEAEAAGATAEETERIVDARRRLAEIIAEDKRADEAEREAEKERRTQEQRFEQLKKSAESLRDTLRSPAEALADQFAEFDELFSAGMLSANELAEARKRAVAATPEEKIGSLNGLAAGSKELYDAIASQQREDRERRTDEERRERLIAAADAINAKDNERLTIQRKITGEIEKQAAANVAGGSAGGAGPAAGESDEYLDRIATATERSADALSRLEPVAGV